VRSPYEVFGIGRAATQEDVKARYRQLAKERHPDTGGTENAFKELQTAYDWLKANHQPVGVAVVKAVYQHLMDTFVVFRVLDDDKYDHLVELPERPENLHYEVKFMHQGKEFSVILPPDIKLPLTLRVKGNNLRFHNYVPIEG
jgi:hypothetical protein